MAQREGIMKKSGKTKGDRRKHFFTHQSNGLQQIQKAIGGNDSGYRLSDCKSTWLKRLNWTNWLGPFFTHISHCFLLLRIFPLEGNSCLFIGKTKDCMLSPNDWRIVLACLDRTLFFLSPLTSTIEGKTTNVFSYPTTGKEVNRIR